MPPRPSKPTRTVELRALLAGLAGLLAACGAIQPKLATDPNAFAPPTATKSWAPEEATRIPGGKATLDAFSARSAPSSAAIHPGRDYDQMGPFLVGTGVLEPLLRLDWLLLDFGRRTADLDSAAQTLLAANLQFNRKQQSVIFAVQKAYFAFDAGRARVTARET